MKPEAEARQRRGVEREGRRRRRREKRQRAGQAVVHDEGMSSDDELLETDRMEFTDKFGEHFNCYKKPQVARSLPHYRGVYLIIEGFTSL